MFTDEQLERFQHRYEEGYDIYVDCDYVRWLELHHPKSLPANRYSLSPFLADDSHQMLLAENFISVTPEVPLLIHTASDTSQSFSDQPSDNVPTNDANMFPSNALTLGKPGGVSSTDVSQANKTQEAEASISPLSKYLTLPTSSTPSMAKPLPRACLLTSAECLAQLEKKEQQKQLATEEKEQRKK